MILITFLFVSAHLCMLIRSSALPVHCNHEGKLVRHPHRCDAFIQCDNGRTTEHDCPLINLPNPLANDHPRLFFNEDAQVCDWPNNVNCGQDSQFVCYGDRKQPVPYGVFTAPRAGTIKAIRLTHFTGELSCPASKPGFWNCIRNDNRYLNTVVTLKTKPNDGFFQDIPIFPDTVTPNQSGEYMFDPFYARSKELYFVRSSNYLKVYRGEEMRIWYANDYLFQDIGAKTTDGGHCVYIELSYVHSSGVPL